MPLILKSSGYSLQQNGSQEIVSGGMFVRNWNELLYLSNIFIALGKPFA